jgi:taurine dioxygenase
MYAAYDALPRRLKEQLEGQKGAFTYGGRKKSTTLLNEEDRARAPALHPLIRTHPETRRKALYFDPGKILRIEGLDELESDAVIEELTELMIQPDAQYRHRWTAGDVVIWDNRCSYHLAAGDYPPDEDRIHWRVSIRLLLGRAFKRSDDFVRVPSIGVSCTGGRSHLRARRIAAVITKLGQAL